MAGCATASLAVAVLLTACGTQAATGDVRPPAPRVTAGSVVAPPPETPARPRVTQPLSKVLVVVEENHSLAQMKAGMPYAYGLAQRYGYATAYAAVRHPSLPNYLAITGGSTAGVTDDRPPADHQLSGTSVFGQALAAGHTARVYAEGMTSNCQTGDGGRYAVKHNPWAYFTSERSSCTVYDVPVGDPGSGQLALDAKADRLPDVGLVVPDLSNDAHDGSLGAADAWLCARLPAVLASDDFTSGRLAVVITADEDDRNSGNVVLTAVLHASLDGLHAVVSTPLTHYSLTRLYAEVSGAAPLAAGATAPDLASAFGLRTTADKRPTS